ncbi:23S ribosomal RNA methyltransferase [Xylaria nigripes]|nr:23S ribosomal RNA methyltransferase [Xylaria nigripes]
MPFSVNAAVPHSGRLVGAIAAQLLPRSSGLIINCNGIRWSSSNSQWLQRRQKDIFAREAKLRDLRARSSMKLLEMDAKYRLFKRGQAVGQVIIDLGYAPGGWSQVARDRTAPSGRIIGVDIIPTQPPKGVSAIQGNFLLPSVRKMVKQYLIEVEKPRSKDGPGAEVSDEGLITEKPSYIDAERAESIEHAHDEKEDDEKLVDIVLSDMSEPWPLVSGYFSRTMSNPYYRMMNTSGNSFRDHAGSMDLCLAALQFASDTLRAEGHFVCKFYQGSEDKSLELKLKKMFGKVDREKPEASRSGSKECYFVARHRKRDVKYEDISDS